MTDAKPLTKSEIAARLAEKVGITKKQALAFFEAQSELAYSQAKNSFTLPGIGKLILAQTKPVERMQRFGADKGQMKMYPAKTKLKFRLAKAAKDAILNAK